MISTVEKVLILKSINLFGQIPSEELSQIAEISDEVEFETGESLMQEGEIGDELYLIVEGKVRVHKGEISLVELGERECVGEMSILDSEPRSASVTALEEVRALKVRREDFTEIMSEKVTIAQGIIKVLLKRLREANTKR